MTAATLERPKKPSANFPLYPHRVGQWAKKVRGRTFYFGVWADPEAALNLWLRQKDDLYAGRSPRETEASDLTIRELCNLFLTTKKGLKEQGELTQRTWDDYFQSCNLLCKIVGKDRAVVNLAPSDFEKLRKEYAAAWGPVRVGNEIQRVRCVMRYASQEGHLDKPILYGDGFRKPSLRTLRRERAKGGTRMFEAAELRKLIEHSNPLLRTMILLAINCGLGNHDVAAMTRKHIDLKTGWLDYPRPKTGVLRRSPLWPETVAALKNVLRHRKARAEASRANRKSKGLVFLTKSGASWIPQKTGNPISMEFLDLARRARVWRKGLGFYALRHTFETVGGDSKDQIAVDFIMGHAADSRDMSAKYRERIEESRLQAVTDHIHKWLFPEQHQQPQTGGG